MKVIGGMSKTDLILDSFIKCRYMAVSNPLRYRIALVESTPMTRAFKYIVPAVFCSFALNIPKFLEVEVSEGVEKNRKTKG